MSEAARYNLEIDAGTTWELDCAYTRSSTPVSLSGYQIRCTIRREYDGQVLLYLSSEDGAVSIDTSLGTFTITATAAQTQNLASSSTKAVHTVDMYTTAATPYVKRLMYGNVRINRDT